LENLYENKNIKLNDFLSCIYYFLKIIEMALFKSYSTLFNNFIYKIQYILVIIGKKYDLINKYFDMKDNEIISQKDLMKNKSANGIIEFQNEISNDNHNNFVKNNTMGNSTSFEIYKKNILQNSFVIYIMFFVVGAGWALINVNSYPMMVEMSSSKNIGKYTGLYYTASMIAQSVTPILLGAIIAFVPSITLKHLFVYAGIMAMIAFILILFFKETPKAFL
jgi:sugar phosphate permease